MENTLPTFEEMDPTDVVLSVDSFDEPAEEVEEQESEEQVEDTPDAPEEDPLAKVTYESLVERGLLEADEAFNGTFEYIDEKLDSLPSKLLRSAIDDLPEHSQVILKYIAAAGTNLEPDELKAYMKEYLGEQDVPDISTSDAARSFLEKHLKDQGLRNNAIQAQLDDLEDSDELLTEAEKILNSKEKKTDVLLREKQEDIERTRLEQQNFIKSVNTTLSEIGWSKPQQDKVRQIIPKTNEILGQIVKSPKAYVQLMDLLGKFNGTEFDLEAFRKQGEGRVNSTLKDKINKSGFSSNSSKTKSSTELPTNDIFKEFKPFV